MGSLHGPGNPHPQRTQSLGFVPAIAPDSQTLASAGGNGVIFLWNLGNGQRIRTLQGHRDGVWSLAISPDGKTLISGSWDRTIKLWNLATGTLQGTLNGHSDYVVALSLSPDSQTLISGGWQGQIKLWQRQSAH
ncbi:MAG: hypothetical protein HC890_11850 [Chloroflexaceae bacterium]|nr:hypothetical protein [Chloroflexaceae bacterium]